MEPLSFGARLWLAFLLPFQLLFDAVLAARVAAVVRGQALPRLPSEVETKPEPRPELKPGIKTKLESKPEPKPEPKPAPKVVEPEIVAPPPDRTAMQLLAILQREGRFVDFLQEDVSSFSDADIGAAARVVHEGCRKVLREHFMIEPVLRETEGSQITVSPGFDASAIRLTGNVVGSAPFNGVVGHRGWRATDVHLPKVADGHNIHVLAPAEVEL